MGDVPRPGVKAETKETFAVEIVGPKALRFEFVTLLVAVCGLKSDAGCIPFARLRQTARFSSGSSRHSVEGRRRGTSAANKRAPGTG